MLTRERLSLLLSIIVVVALLTFLFATLPTSGESSAASPISKVLVRRHDRRTAPLTKAELSLLRGQQPTIPERGFEDTTPKHVPIKIRIRPEKEKAFRDLGNSQWLREMEIEVKNTGNKPIYFLSFIIDLPEIVEANNKVGWEVHYGRSDLVSLDEPVKTEDIPIRPGETHLFTLADRFVRGWERAVREEHLPAPHRVRVLFQFINFGDGTGLDTTTGVPVSKQPHVATNLELNDTKKPKTHWPLIALNDVQDFNIAKPASPSAGKIFVDGSFQSNYG